MQLWFTWRSGNLSPRFLPWTTRISKHTGLRAGGGSGYCRASGREAPYPIPSQRYNGNTMAPNRQHAHQLLDQLGSGQLAAVVHLLETMVSPDEDGDTLSNAERKEIG